MIEVTLREIVKKKNCQEKIFVNNPRLSQIIKNNYKNKRIGLQIATKFIPIFRFGAQKPQAILKPLKDPPYLEIYSNEKITAEIAA